LLGGTGSYVIGRVFGRPVVQWLGVGPLLARNEELVSCRTPFAFAFLLQAGVPSEVPGYLFGLGRYPYVRYLTSLGLAELPYGFATVYLGAGIVQRRTTMVLAVASAVHAPHRMGLVRAPPVPNPGRKDSERRRAARARV